MRYNKNKLIVFVVGARPNFMKAAPLLREFGLRSGFKTVLIHTGQHFDNNMSQLFFRDLNMRRPDYNLGINSASHAVLTANMMVSLEKKFISMNPDLVIVVGDVDSTLAVSLTASKLFIPVAHVESGLRSFDPNMPEEINRKITDMLSEYLFIHSEDAKTNLINEGIPVQKIYYVGNVMIDMLKQMLNRTDDKYYLTRYGLQKEKYALMTLHRPSNVDSKNSLTGILSTIARASGEIPVIFPVHPRTAEMIKKYNCSGLLRESKIITTKPLGYLENLSLMKNSRFVLTDSGGIQEETTYLRIPCLTMRENTERPVTIEIGTNTIVGNSRTKILTEIDNILGGKYKSGKIPKYWDGKASKRILKVIQAKLRR